MDDYLQYDFTLTIDQLKNIVVPGAEIKTADYKDILRQLKNAGFTEV